MVYWTHAAKKRTRCRPRFCHRFHTFWNVRMHSCNCSRSAATSSNFPINIDRQTAGVLPKLQRDPCYRWCPGVQSVSAELSRRCPFGVDITIGPHLIGRAFTQLSLRFGCHCLSPPYSDSVSVDALIFFTVFPIILQSSMCTHVFF